MLGVAPSNVSTAQRTAAFQGALPGNKKPATRAGPLFSGVAARDYF
jgi:hypothetical protein